MKMSLTDEQVMIKDLARQFAEAELLAHAEKLDLHDGHAQFLENLRKLAELGFMGLNIKSEYGGVEVGTIGFSVAITEIARACSATAVTVSVTNMVAEVIQSVGTSAQCEAYLPKLCSGAFAAGSFCLTEAGAGSDPAMMQTSALRDGDDWVINGSKLYITSADYAGIFVVWAVTDNDKPKGKGISCFLVEADTAGIFVDKAESKMGQRGSSTNTVRFEDCRIPATALLGDECGGFRIAVTELAGGRIGIASLAIGIGTAALDFAKNHLGEREQFGKKIGSFQGLQWMLADRCTEMEASRLLVMQAAYDKDQGMDFGKSAAMAKLFASEKANDACYSALQMMGGAGYIQDFPLERLARDVRVTTIYEGTSEIQRIIIARELLRGTF